ncbi:MAG: CbiX/SirB N-terminal domain-containing protein [Verrucomicrobiota bacterium]
MNSPSLPVCFLFDNGSLRPASTLCLRRVAAALAAHTGREVRAVSLLHSDRVPPGELGDAPAELMEPAVEKIFAANPAGQADLLPLFFGPSAAVHDHVPNFRRSLREKFPAAQVRLAPCLVNPTNPTDCRMARMLAEHVWMTVRAAGWRRPKVLLVDHGSPTRAVTAVRDHLAAQLRAELGADAAAVGAASMERRDGAEFDFNEPLLSRALRTEPFDTGDVVVALQFLSPGRHAGPGGDVAEICRAAEAERPTLRTCLTEPLAAHPLLVDVLTDRLAAAREI